jgi:hypothetical protein
MPLIFTGQQAKTMTGVSLQATNSEGESVVVQASDEAIQDFGMGRVQDVASNKYDKGQTEGDGSIFIRTVDCA